MAIDAAAGRWIGTDLQNQKRKRRNERKVKRRPESVAGVRNDDGTVKRKIRNVEHPGIRNVEQEVQTETSLETRTEAAGAPGAGALRETTAGIEPLIERTKTETLPPKGEEVAAALRATETREETAEKAQILNGGERRVPPDPKTEKARPNRDQKVQKAKTGMRARGRNQALAPAQALTATNILKK